MKNLIWFVFAFATALPVVSSADVYVNGYYRSDGTYVDGYMRSEPNGIKVDNSNTSKVNIFNIQLKDKNEAENRLRQDNEALRKSVEASMLRTKLDAITNQLRSIGQQNSSDNCSALYNLNFSNPLTCSDDQYQRILQEKAEAKSRVDSMLFSQGLAGNQEIRETRMAEIDAQYSSRLESCKGLQEYNDKARQDYEQCKTDQRSAVAEKIRKEQELQRQKVDNEKKLGKIKSCFASLGKNIKFDNNYNCSCAEGYSLIGGYCTNKMELANVCKQVLGDNGVVAGVSNNDFACGCKEGYLVKDSKCTLMPQDSASFSQKISDITKTKVSENKAENFENTIDSNRKVSSGAKEGANTLRFGNGDPRNEPNKILGWLKRIFGF